MSRVFVAREIALDRLVVIKVLPADLMAGVSIDRFRREIQLSARLQHSNIVPVLAAGEVDGVPYYIMPFVRGESLRERMRRDGALPIAEVVTLLRDVARALAAAHALGIAHRDIKPENVLLSGGAAVVTDFGIAKAISAARTRGDSETAPSKETLTQIGVSVGTPAYMAPEQAAGDPATDQRSDIYSFGVVAYELLAGRALFDATRAHELVTAHMGEAPVPIGTRRPDTPPALAALVMSCLAKDPNDRPSTTSAVLDALDAAAGAGTVAPTGRNLARVLTIYGVAFAAVALAARLAITGIGLPEWVFPGALAVMALGLPATLFLSPQRAVRGGVAALGALVLVVAGYMTLRALGIGPVGSLFAKGVLKERDKVVVTDFRVVRADSTFGAMLSEAVRTGLSQSGAISVVSPADVGAALRLMRHDPSLPLDLAAARDVALRRGAKAVVDGDVSGVAGGYVVSLRLVTADSAKELASFHAAADGPKALIEAADALTRQLRAKTGESLRGVNGTPALSAMTTSSIEALRAYALGALAYRESKFERAIALYREAVRLDTSFAMGWSNLGNALGLLGMRAGADSALRRAFQLRDRLSEWERLWVTGIYFGFPSQRDPIAAGAAFQALLDHGDSSLPLQNLATLMLNRRDYARAEPLFRAGIRLRPTPIGRLNLVPVLFNQGKSREAESTFASAQSATPNHPLVPQWAAELAYQRGDVPTVARIADSARSSPTPMLQIWGASRLADLALLRGQVSTWERYMRESSAADAARGAPSLPVIESILFAYRDVWMSESPARGLARLDAALTRQALDSSVHAEYHYLAAITYALGGRTDRARATLARYDAVARDTIQRRLDEPGRHRVLGEIALTEKRWREGIAELRRSDSTAKGMPADVCRICVYGMLGRAFDRAAMPDSAIVMYETYLHTPYFMRGAQSFVPQLGGADSYWVAAITKRLGELYDQRGDRVRAAANYVRFVELWKNADAEFQPAVTAVRGRLTQLKKVEGS